MEGSVTTPVNPLASTVPITTTVKFRDQANHETKKESKHQIYKPPVNMMLVAAPMVDH